MRPMGGEQPEEVTEVFEAWWKSIGQMPGTS